MTEKVRLLSHFHKFYYKFMLCSVLPLAAVFSLLGQLEGNALTPSENQQSTYELPQPISTDIPQEGRYDLMLDSVLGPLTYYNQGDSRWGGYLYGGRDPMATYGCGPTVMAMLITSLTGNQVLPTDVADWAAANQCWCPGEGSYHRLVPDSAAAYGLSAVPLRNYSAQGLKDALDSGHLIVALMKKGHFTNQGHFIILTRFTENGKIRIADSNNYENTKYDWDPEVILNELNHHSGNGGPLWSIGLPESIQ